jgi:hypothetical protein
MLTEVCEGRCECDPDTLGVERGAGDTPSRMLSLSCQPGSHAQCQNVRRHARSCRNDTSTE